MDGEEITGDEEDWRGGGGVGVVVVKGSNLDILRLTWHIKGNVKTELHMNMEIWEISGLIQIWKPGRWFLKLQVWMSAFKKEKLRKKGAQNLLYNYSSNNYALPSVS